MRLGNFGRIAFGWSIITVGGIYSFILSKKSVDKRRFEDMQIRERMRKSNLGDYEAVGNRKFGA